IGMVNPQTKAASLQAHVNPLVSFVWLGVIILILGAVVAMWPEASAEEVGVFGYVRVLGTVGMMVMLSVALALMPSKAFAQQHEMRRAGTVGAQTTQERALFQQLLCDCGTCPHEALATCGCGWAEAKRAELRTQLASGTNIEEIVRSYGEKHGLDAVLVQIDKGGARALWALPLVALVGGGALVYRFARRRTRAVAVADGAPAVDTKDALDDRLDRELRDLDEDR
ncbi:MAG: hypothetical protein EXR75_16945, partial [Myxococcales bacterium]|nr:hypothetical protein [Myxococcales bacterium]